MRQEQEDRARGIRTQDNGINYKTHLIIKDKMSIRRIVMNLYQRYRLPEKYLRNLIKKLKWLTQ